MKLSQAILVCFLLMELCFVGCNADALLSKTKGSGLSVSPEVYSSNLQYLKNDVIPKGWALNAVIKWNAYGHDIPSLAGAATKLGLSVSVLTNKEASDVLAASRAAGVSKPVIWRIMPADGPAKYPEVLEAARAGMGIQETMTPLNQKDILKAAKAAGRVIPVQIYLYSHYEQPYGYNFTTSKQLKDLVGSLDPKLVKVVGFMTHNGGLTAAEALTRIKQFNSVVCPVAKSMAARQPVMLHFASSTDVSNMLPDKATRMQPPAGLCSGPNITWVARVGSLTYGSDKDDNAKLQGGTSPVMTWFAKVSDIRTAAGPGGAARKLATVNLQPHRYPAPSWWEEVLAFIPETPGKAAGYQPDSFVLIKGKKYQLASIPTDGSKIVVDVTKAPAGGGVAVGDSVCIICDQHSLGALAKEVGADDYNAALCLTGLPAVVGSNEETPQCKPASKATASG